MKQLALADWEAVCGQKAMDWGNPEGVRMQASAESYRNSRRPPLVRAA